MKTAATGYFEKTYICRIFFVQNHELINIFHAKINIT